VDNCADVEHSFSSTRASDYTTGALEIELRITFSDEANTGRASVALRGVGRVTIAVRAEDPEGFDWVMRLAREHFPGLKELKSAHVLPLMSINPRVRDQVMAEMSKYTAAIIDFREQTRSLISDVATYFGVPVAAAGDPMEILNKRRIPPAFATVVLSRLRDYRFEHSTIPRIEGLLDKLLDDVDLPHGAGAELVDREALKSLDALKFQELAVRFALAFGDALRPSAQVPAILSALQGARYLNERRHAFFLLLRTTEPERVYDQGRQDAFDLLQAAHRDVVRHLEVSDFATLVSDLRPGSIRQDDSSRLLGLQAADIGVGVACDAFESHGAETLAGAQAVKRHFAGVLLNDRWV